MASINSWIYEEDIGNMCNFLISDDAKNTGQDLLMVMLRGWTSF